MQRHSAAAAANPPPRRAAVTRNKVPMNSAISLFVIIAAAGYERRAGVARNILLIRGLFLMVRLKGLHDSGEDASGAASEEHVGLVSVRNIEAAGEAEEAALAFQIPQHAHF